MKILVDENLTPDLTKLGGERGYLTTCTRDLGLIGRKDFQLIPYCIENDYVLMSIDDGDPKRLAESSGLHPGLVFLIAGGYDDMFVQAGEALEYIEDQAAAAGEQPAEFMVNRVVERDEDGNWFHYDLPAEEPDA